MDKDAVRSCLNGESGIVLSAKVREVAQGYINDARKVVGDRIYELIVGEYIRKEE
jgi:hypothetical protein